MVLNLINNFLNNQTLLNKSDMMKYVILFTFLLGSLSIYGQETKETCNQLPYAKVEKKAELTMDLEKLIKKEMHASLKEDGSHSGIIKAIC